MSDAARNITIDLIEGAKNAPEAVALTMGDRQISYSELDGLVWGAARFLSGNGVREGDIVAMLFAGQLPLAYALLGAMRLGASTIVLSPTLTPTQREELIAESGARLLFTDKPQRSGASTSTTAFDETHLSDKSESLGLLCEYPDAPAQILVGSGSTGKQKLIPVSHREFRARTKIIGHCFKLVPGRRFLAVIPLQFSSLTARFLGLIAAGATCILWDQKERIISAIERIKPDCLELTVFHAEMIIRQSVNRQGFDLSSIEIVAIGSSTISETLRKRLKENLKTNLYIGYATNEVATIAFANPDDLRAVKGGVGHPLPGTTLEIVDGMDRPTPRNEIGVVRVKTPAKIDGYWDGSHSDRFRDGWFYPGDLGKLTEDGQLVHCGRADQMMILDGMNIYPAEIERTLGNHPAVQDIAVFPLRHQVHQDMPVAVVSLKPNMQVDLDELQKYAREQLGLRTPRHIMIVDELPRNDLGKLIRPELERLMSQDFDEKAENQGTRTKPGKAAVSRQRMSVQKLNFHAPENRPSDVLDAWRPYFHDDTFANVSEKISVEFPAEVASAVAWFEHVLALVRDLLISVHIPFFENPTVISCTRSAEQENGKPFYEAIVRLPLLENYHPGTFSRALVAAISCTEFMQANPPTEENREKQYDRIRKEIMWRIIQGAKYGSCTNRVLHAAYTMGIPYSHLGQGIYQLGWGASATLIDRSTSSKDSAMSNKLTFFKQATASLIRSAGLPAPVHILVNNLEAARKAAERIGWPLVVKPEDQERGEGVHVDVQPEQLESAFQNALAASNGNRVLIERQVSGVCHRLFMASGRLLYAVKRMPIGVYGDGKRTVSELVADECAAQMQKPTWVREKIKPIDDLGRASIKAADLTETSVPEKGQFVALRRIETTEWGGVDEEVTDVVHPENIRVALAATKLCGLDVAGIDIITDDITKPWTETGAIINEVNYKPLLGGGEISRQYLVEYVNRILDGSGRIPVEVFVGDERALEAAKAHQDALNQQGVAAYLTDGSQTLGTSGQEFPVAVNGLYARVRALALSGYVEAIVVVVTDDALLNRSLPLEGVDAVHNFGEPTLSQSRESPFVRRQKLMQLLSGWVWPGKTARSERN